MNGKMNVLGVEIDNLKVVEAMERVETFLETKSLNTIGIINAGVLLEAGKDTDYRERVESLDLSVVGDRDVLLAAGIQDAERHLEAEDGWFLTTFLEYCAQNEKSLAVLGETKKEADTLREHLLDNFPGLHLAGVFSMEDMTGDPDSLINLINGTAPEIILASLSTPQQEDFVTANKTKLGARVWIGTGKTLKCRKSLELKTGFWDKLIEKRIFKKKISKYQQEKGES